MHQATKLGRQHISVLCGAVFAISIAACGGGAEAPVTSNDRDGGRAPASSTRDAGPRDAGMKAYRGDAARDAMMSTDTQEPNTPAPSCSGADCPAACDDEHADCDGNQGNGCERLVNSIFSCGACDRACTSGANASPECKLGRCSYACAPGFADCDGEAANGCEQDVRSAEHCGTCGTRCSAAEHAAAVCRAGACGRLCDEGYGNCDENAENGCEVATSSSDQHCGGCGQACSARTGAEGHCQQSSCHYTCTTHHFDCDHDLSNGCECEGRRMFITSQAYPASFGGVAAADAICAELAAKAGLPGVYKAWVSDASSSAADRLEHSSLPYYRLNEGDRLDVAMNWADLTDEISVAIATDEYGQVQGYKHVWTGTSREGAVLTYTCQNWTTTSSSELGGQGHSSSGGQAWTFNTWGNCSEQGNFYCIEQ